MNRFTTALKVLFTGKPIMFGQRIAYEPWTPSVGVTYFYPSDLHYGEADASSSTFNEYEVKRYPNGRKPTAFACKEHAMEASRRMLKVLNDYHEELGY